MIANRVPGFSPSSYGLRFPNTFAKQPVFDIRFAGLRLPAGNARNGLCGGMVFAARDLFQAGLAPPASSEPPTLGSPMYRYVVERLFASFNLPMGPLKYLVWMWLPQHDTRVGRGVRTLTIQRQWPLVRGDIDRGRLSPLGLVTTKSRNPLRLGINHQVLAYGYRLDRSQRRLAIEVYDPNHAADDSVVIDVDLSPGPRPGPLGHLRGTLPVYGFFRTRYTFRHPEALGGLPTASGQRSVAT